jgi:hypothetical protein
MKKRAKKPAINIKINFTNRWLYTLILFGIIIGISVGVYAYGGRVAPSIVGHTMNETAPPSPCVTNQYLQWSGSAWVCATVSAATPPTCSNGQVLKYTAGAWSCISEADPRLPACAANQILRMNSAGTGWICAEWSGYTIVSQICTASAACVVNCPAGEQVLGGGCTTAGYYLTASGPGTPSNPGSTTSWMCQIGSGVGKAVYAICAKIS